MRSPFALRTAFLHYESIVFSAPASAPGRLDERGDAGEVCPRLRRREPLPDRGGDPADQRGSALVLHLLQVEAHVLVHQGVGEAGGEATGEHVVRELVVRGGAAAARCVQHLDHRRRVEAHRAPEGQRLAGRGEGGGRQEVVGQLQRLGQPGAVTHPGAAVAQAGEHRLDVGARVVLGRVHDGEGPRSGSGHATRHRRVDVADARAGEPCRDRTGGAHADGRRVDDVGGATFLDGDDLLAPPTPTRPRPAGSARPRRPAGPRSATSAARAAPSGCARVPVGVVGHHRVARGHEVRRERAAHVPEADEPDHEVSFGWRGRRGTPGSAWRRR